MMSDWQSRLAEVLGRYDEKAGAFSVESLLCSLEGVCQGPGRPSGDAPEEFDAEVMAFAFSENRTSDEGAWGTHFGPMWSNVLADGTTSGFPMLAQVTPAVLAYWSKRAGEVKHPFLQYRYAGLVWDLGGKVKGTPRRAELARVMVDAAVASARWRELTHLLEVSEMLEWAYEVSGSLKDVGRVEAVRNAFIDFEKSTARDELPGTWGRCFDVFVVNENRRYPVPETQRAATIREMEDRLARLAAIPASERVDPHAVDAAALRLAKHYRRREQPEDMRRVLEVYANTHLRKAEVVSGLEASSALMGVCDVLNDFGLREAAEAVAAQYRRHAERTKEELQTFSHSFSIPKEEIDKFLQNWSSGPLEQHLCQFVAEFIPSRKDAETRVRERASGTITSHFSTLVLDADGRATAKVGPVDTDFEGHVARNIAELMGMVAPFLRLVVDKLVATYSLDTGRVVEHLSHLPVFDRSSIAILEAGLRAYFAQNWLVAIHLLVPQVEQAFRRLIQLSGGSALKQGRDGTLPLKTLDDLLRDERVVKAFGADAALYFRIVLTDQRCWNVRNSVSHGFARVDHFQPAVADRLLHILLFFGMLKFGRNDTTGVGENATGRPADDAPHNN